MATLLKDLAHAGRSAAAAWLIAQRYPDDPLLQAQAHWTQGTAILYVPEYVRSLEHYVEHDTGGTPWNELLINPATAQHAQLEPGVVSAWEAYARATSYDLTATTLMDDDELQGSYTRFAIQCLKVAMLLATMDSEQLPVRVALRH
jgi:hypothetical protein